MHNLDIGWLHPDDLADQWDGFNEPGVEHFSGKPIQHLAREIVQNSLDAADGDVVEVRFKTRNVKTSDIPNVEQLRQNLVLCRQSAKNESEKATQFFDESINLLRRDEVSVLQVSDYGTKGMIGPSKNGTPFYAFMKAKGQSKKNDNTATGSFGIGKFAPYAVSKLRTIFVSTVYQDDIGNYCQLTQGKSIFMSHDDGNNRRQGIGFWGITDRCQPVDGFRHDLPDWIQRTNSSNLVGHKGSTLSIIGFDTSLDWEYPLAASIVENFFGAIFDGRLAVVIGDKFALDKSNIVAFFESDDFRSQISNLDNEPELFNNCRSYLSAHCGGDEVHSQQHVLPTLGLCQLNVVVADGLPKKVCVLRNGMFITDSLYGLKRFSDFKDFVAVFHCCNSEGNAFLRAMEPPRHDDFEYERLPTHDQHRGKLALKQIADWARGVLAEHAKDPVSDVTSIDELKDLLGDDGDGQDGNTLEEINPFGSVVIHQKPMRKRNPIGAEAKPADSYTDDDGSSGDLDDTGSGGGGQTGAGGGDGKGGAGAAEGDGTGGGAGGTSVTKGRAQVDIGNVRAINLGNQSRRVAFTPFTNGKFAIGIQEAGADSDYPLTIVSVNDGSINDGFVEVSVEANKRVVLDVNIAERCTGALKVIAYEIR